MRSASRITSTTIQTSGVTTISAAQLNAVVVDMIESVAETEKPDNDENK